MHRKRVKATRTHKIELGSRSAEVCPAGKSRFMGVRIEFTGPFRHSTPTRPFLSNCHLYPLIITQKTQTRKTWQEPGKRQNAARPPCGTWVIPYSRSRAKRVQHNG